MGVEASYRRLSPVEFKQLLDDDKRADAYFGLDIDDDEGICEYCAGLEASDRYLDIDKSWHGLHFLLTGEAELGETQVPPPLGNVVMGGAPTKWEATYGVVRFLTPPEVKAVAEALAEIDETDLSGRYDLEAFRNANIYPGARAWDEDGWSELLDVFGQVRDFFKHAAEGGELVLLSSD